MHLRRLLRNCEEKSVMNGGSRSCPHGNFFSRDEVTATSLAFRSNESWKSTYIRPGLNIDNTLIPLRPERCCGDADPKNKIDVLLCHLFLSSSKNTMHTCEYIPPHISIPKSSDAVRFPFLFHAVRTTPSGQKADEQKKSLTPN